jgi:UDP-2,3-diacylglucosamine pyrophosphatase LpxH
MKTFYRSVWISDVHLGTKDCQSEMLYSFLDSIKCDYLYLVGDIIDVWAMRRKWHWPKQYNEVVHKLLKRSRKGAKVVYIPGNHDEFFREFLGYQFGDVEVVQHAIHETADGRKLLVLHGDVFDTIVLYKPWLSHLGSWAYGHLITLNRFFNGIRKRFGMPYWSLSGAIKRKVKEAVKFLTNFEQLLIDEAKRMKVDGVVCGHIHQPAMHDMEGVQYINTGDWVENCTAVVEHEDGTLEIIWWHKVKDQRCADMASQVSLQRHLEFTSTHDGAEASELVTTPAGPHNGNGKARSET